MDDKYSELNVEGILLRSCVEYQLVKRMKDCERIISGLSQRFFRIHPQAILFSSVNTLKILYKCVGKMSETLYNTPLA